MQQNQNFSPYYDDFDKTKGFYKVLFKPEVAVQARELTQSQSILQNQIKNVGDSLFQDGSLVIPGAIGYDPNVGYVKLQDQYLSIDIDVDNFDGKRVTGQTSGVVAEVIKVVEIEDSEPNTLIVKYVSSGTDNETTVFSDNEVLETDDGTPFYCKTATSSSTGDSSIATIQEGVYYVGGYFVNTSQQILILEKYNNTPSYKVGVRIVESIIDSGDDNSLLDPATGEPNFAAPGADRYKIELVLAKRTLTSIDEDNFIELLRIDTGVIKRKIDKPAYSYFNEVLASRTYDESGNYTVKPFGLDVREHLNDGSNRGIYIAGNGGDETKLALGIEAGKGYVFGYEVENVGTNFIETDKARNSTQVNNSYTSALLGNYILLDGNDIYCFPDLTNYETVSLQNTATATPGTAAGDSIGTARARAIELNSGVAGSGTENYKLFVFDIQMSNDTGTATSATSTTLVDSGASWTTDIWIGGTVIITGGTGIGQTRTIIDNNGTSITVATWSVTPDSTSTYLIKQNLSSVKQIYKSGSPAFTADIDLNADSECELYEQDQGISIYNLPSWAIKKVRDASNSVDTSYTVKRILSGTTDSNGQITFTISGGTDELFDTFNTKDYVLCITSGAEIGSVVDLTGNVVVAGSPTGKELQIDISATYASMGVRVEASVIKTVAGEKTKTLQSGTAAFSSPTSTMSLGRADIYQITGIYDSENAGVDATSSDLNITDRYNLDNGQRDNFYANGSITLKTNASAPTGRVLIEFEYFSHGTGDYFSVDSYSGQIDYENIPVYTATTGQTFYLRDCLDFRPRQGNGSSTFTSTGSSLIEYPEPDSNIVADYQYYLNRIDKVYVDTSGNFGVVKGISGTNPPIPQDKPGTMTLYNLYIPAYTFSTKDVYVEMLDNRRYTMRDIGKLDKRLSNVEYYTSLSLLEKSTASLQIIDPNTGLDRYKNGFVVDQFTGHGVGDVLSNDYRCAVDKVNNELRPPFTEDNIDLVYSSGDSSNVQKTGDLITLPYTTSTFISQPYASRTENVNPFNIFTFIGSITLSPTTDDWKDLDTQPDLNVNLPDNVDLLTDLATRTGIVGTQWNDWQTSWTGVPQVTTTVSTVTVAGNNVAPAGNNWPLRTDTITRTTTSTQVGQTQTGTKTTIMPQTVNLNLGERLISVDVIPYMRSRDVTFSAVRMKPNTKIYPFFDDVDVSAYCKPSGGNYGDDLITDSNGAISGATFTIPNTETLRFRVGDRIFKLTDSSTDSDDNTTESTAIYSAYGLAQEKQSTILSTRVAQVNTQQVSQSRVITDSNTSTVIDHGGWYDPLSQTFLVSESGGCFVSPSIELFFKEKDDNLPITVQLRPTVNGYPSQKLFPFGEITLNPSSVNISDDASLGTTFTFPSPVYMLQDTEYCFVVMSDSNKYRIYTGRIGDTLLGTDRIISQQPYAGVMFLSQNASTWTADQTQDIMFNIKKCVFNTGVTGNVVLKNDTVSSDVLINNPFYTTNSSTDVRVSHKWHGLVEGDSVVISGVSSGTYNNIPYTELNGTHTISDVDLQGYTITVTTSANANGDVGGASVIANRNMLMDVVHPSISESVFSNTSLSWQMKSTTGKHPHGSQTAYSLSSSYFDVQTNDNNVFNVPMIIASSTNETNHLSGVKSMWLKGTLNSSNTNLSPVIDLERCSLITVGNLIDSPTSSNVNNYVSEIDGGESGSVISKYITKRLTLSESANSITVYAAVNKPNDASVEVYYKVQNPDNTTQFSDLQWIQMSQSNTAYSTDESTQFYEYVWTVDDLSQFTTFQIKVVMKSTDSTKIPRIKEFRAIALGT